MGFKAMAPDRQVPLGSEFVTAVAFAASAALLERCECAHTTPQHLKFRGEMRRHADSNRD